MPSSDKESRSISQGIVHDRAAVVTTTLTSVVTSALRDWLHAGTICERQAAKLALTRVRVEFEETLRDEFADIRREAAGEREPPDAA